MQNMSYEQRLKLMDLPSLVYRRCRGMTEMYKYMHGNYSVPSDSILKKASPSALHGHICKLLKRHCNFQRRLQSFIFRVVNSWISLPQEVVLAPSLNAFRGRLDKFWKNYLQVYCGSGDIHGKKTSDQPKGPIGLMSVAEDQGICV